MNSVDFSHFKLACDRLPLIAILRGIHPHEAEGVALTLYEQGFRIIEVPLNSPDALNSLARIRKCLPNDAVLGAGTVLHSSSVQQIAQAGGSLIVMPHNDPDVIRCARQAGMLCLAGAATPAEIFSAIAAGAHAVKLFPAELVTPAVLNAVRAVLPPDLLLFPVGGITPSRMAEYQRNGASGFGLGGALYKPGMSLAQVTERAREFVAAWCALQAQ
ncbi:2-dehydro-3-deoxy-6-phosphogalactonate aldolase [Sapientia aquatica]|uniref:2-dehydro-3-deoxy-6-phosphogalactonate aldolase n=1 Tax=Sapientia aquatica TaxID=1549640 RepID=A0A4R5VRX2_9BURK|nr:2-dehydro-3-deoxy-6-phosphogalactonate aldolase [Sapientia aquatica]TDK60452.1 2-dehydro-3-deoxy-6-phosphogalactonate aldolase [Sapientia aquatica]